MTGADFFRWLHFICLFWMLFGLGAVMVPLWRGWRETEIDRQLTAFEDATTGHKLGLLPGTIAVGASGIALAGNLDVNFITTGWLVALELVYLFVLFFCVPILGHSLNRVQTEVLKSRKRNQPSAGAAGTPQRQRADRLRAADPVRDPPDDLLRGVPALLGAPRSGLRPPTPNI